MILSEERIWPLQHFLHSTAKVAVDRHCVCVFTATESLLGEAATPCFPVSLAFVFVLCGAK